MNFFQHLFQNISILLLQTQVQKQMVHVNFFLWTKTPYRPVGPRNSPLKILRSPDLHPIENIFHLVKRYLDQEAISKNITESFDEVNVLEAFENIPIEIIYKTISSMNRRITVILASKGERIKYLLNPF